MPRAAAMAKLWNSSLFSFFIIFSSIHVDNIVEYFIILHTFTSHHFIALYSILFADTVVVSWIVCGQQTIQAFHCHTESLHLLFSRLYLRQLQWCPKSPRAGSPFTSTGKFVCVCVVIFRTDFKLSPFFDKISRCHRCSCLLQRKVRLNLKKGPFRLKGASSSSSSSSAGQVSAWTLVSHIDWLPLNSIYPEAEERRVWEFNTSTE